MTPSVKLTDGLMLLLWAVVGLMLFFILGSAFVFISLGGIPDLEYLTWIGASVTLLPVCGSKIARIKC